MVGSARSGRIGGSAAQRMPGGSGLFNRAHGPVSERAEVIRLLQQLEHEMHEHSRLLPWLARSRITNRMLGLPPIVRACIFDLDGVLTTSAEVHSAAWAERLLVFPPSRPMFKDVRTSRSRPTPITTPWLGVRASKVSVDSSSLAGSAFPREASPTHRAC